MSVRPATPDFRLVVFVRVARVCAVAVLVIGLVVLIGWALNLELLKRVKPGFAAMKPNTAFCFILASTALALRHHRNLRVGCAVAIIMLGSLSLAQDFTGAEFGTDQLFFRSAISAEQTAKAGRMSPVTAVNFILIGGSLLLLGTRRAVLRRTLEALTLVTGSAALLALIGYAYGAEAFYRLPGFESTALPTAAAFALLSLGLLCARPDGLAGVFAGSGVGGQVLRRFLPLAIAAPAVLGWVVLRGVEAGLFNATQVAAVLAASMVLVLAVFVWWNALSLEATDASRTEAERQVRQSERRERERAAELAAILDAVPTPVFIAHDPDCLHITGNQAADDLLRHSRGDEASLTAPEETRPRNFKAIKDGRDLSHEELPAQRAARGFPVHDFEFSLVFDDGMTREMLGYGTPLWTNEGKPRGAINVLVDITDHKRAEQQLRESEDRLRAIVNTAADAIITIGERGDIKCFNPAAEKMFGFRADEAIGQNVKILMPSPYQDEHDSYIARYVQTGEARIIGLGREVVGRHKDGSTFPVDLAISEVQDGVEKLFTGIIRDISERKRLQADVLNIVKQEQRRIGHELHDSVQQQLTGLGLIAENLAEALSSKDARLGEEALRQSWAERAGRLANGISESLREIHHLARGLVPVEVDSGGLASALTELASSTSQLTITAPQHSGESQANAIRIKCTFKADEPIEVADNIVATHLYRIAQEAVNNAVKHGKCDRIEIEIERTPNRLCLQVVDNGKGIDDKRIWGEFAATDGHRGLGLRTMAYRAGLIGATLKVDRGPERGTRVRCTLPI